MHSSKNLVKMSAKKQPNKRIDRGYKIVRRAKRRCKTYMQKQSMVNAWRSEWDGRSR